MPVTKRPSVPVTNLWLSRSVYQFKLLLISPHMIPTIHDELTIPYVYMMRESKYTWTIIGNHVLSNQQHRVLVFTEWAERHALCNPLFCWVSQVGSFPNLFAWLPSNLHVSKSAGEEELYTLSFAFVACGFKVWKWDHASLKKSKQYNRRKISGEILHLLQWYNKQVWPNYQ